MTETTTEIPAGALARRVYRVIGNYLRYRTREKTGKDDAQFPRNEKGYPVYSHEYLEAKEKVAKEAFLAMRSRRGEDFVEYFTGSICSAPHFLPEEDFLSLSDELMKRPTTVKNLAMLALSAHSWAPSNAKNANTDEIKGDTQ